jgi:hypothetical protein
MTVERVAAFTGHMVDAPDRASPRFPVTKVEAVRKAVAEQLERLNIKYGFSSAARGSDLLFIEELLRANGRARVFLPFPKEYFARTSVGFGWDDRYYQVLRDNRVEVTVLSDHLLLGADESAAYDRCNAEIQEAAIAYAQKTGSKPVLLTVWNGNPGEGRGGTADAVQAWKQRGYEVTMINIVECDDRC